MTTYNFKFLQFDCPADQGQADQLSANLTVNFGLKGWQLVSSSMLHTPNGAILFVCLQKPSE